MKLNISILTIILILITIGSYINLANGGKIINSYSYTYERCINNEDYENPLDVASTLNKQKFCKYIDQLYFKHYQSIFFIFLLLTIVSWKLDSLRIKNEKR